MSNPDGQSISLTVLLFASAQDAAGGLASLALALSPSSQSSFLSPTLADLAIELIRLYPALERVLASSGWAVNELMVGEDEVGRLELSESDVVAVLPPVSGG